MANLPLTVEELFEAALDLPTEQRRPFLEAACRDQPDLRRQAEDLLAEEERAGSFLAVPFFQLPGELRLFTDESSPTLATASEETFIDAPRFQTDDIIASRFVVVRFLARGGMGEVYEVQDLFLHAAHVALKVIRPEIAAHAGSARRFEQEVLLARKVNHPNLCPIYELFRCETPAPPFLFLTMKLLAGETLATRLRVAPALSRADIDLICRELICGVAALHADGIIHRDIKPGNVMLESTPARLRVSLMDFGLARLKESEPTHLPPAPQSEPAGTLVAGTPGYLAPELLEGHLPDEATDIFALGVVFHQMLTGDRPTITRGQCSVASARALRQSQARPQLIHAVEEFLSPSPERRRRAFTRVRLSMELQQPATRLLPPLSRRTFALSAGAAVCGLAASGVWKHEQIHDLLHPLPTKRFVALVSWPPAADHTVMPLLNGIVDAIVNELTRAEAFDRNFFIASQTSATDVSTPAQLNEVRESLGANLVLAASGQATRDSLRVLLQVINPETRRVLRTRELSTAKDRLFALPEQAVRAATELLDLHRFQPDDRRSRFGTDNHDALAAFQAAETLRKQPNDIGLEEGIEHYKQAVDLDPHFAEAHARLAFAYLHLYAVRHDPSALTLARANAETSLVLEPDSVSGHIALAMFFKSNGLYSNALSQLARALALDPTNPRTMVYQAQVYSETNRLPEAEQVYRRVLLARPNDWLSYNELGMNYNLQGRYEQALEAFRAAATASPQQAITFNNIGSVLFQIGRNSEALNSIDRSLALARSDVALQTRTDILRVLGRHTEALEASLESIRLNPKEGLNWLELGDSYAMLPHKARLASEAYARAVAVQGDQLKTNPADGPGSMLLALYRLKCGDTADILQLVVRAEALGAVDIDSQLVKIRILELLGQRDRALQTIATSVRRGATRNQMQAIVDLEALRTDPRYAPIFSDKQLL